MPQTQIPCPQCRQPITANVEQLFDVTSDPNAKQRLLGRVSNYARCQVCGFEGPLATPMVYHDNEKELLLTYFPPELKLSVNDQERMIGPLINQVTTKLPSEKRKGYLLRPQNFLTLQSLIEKILEKDGISKEMLDEQQKRLNLLQRLLQASSPEVRQAIIKENAAALDETFFALFNRLIESALAQGQEQTAQAMGALQQELMENSEYGRKLQGQFAEIEAAVKTLQEAGQGLTREKLLEIFLAAETPERLKALVSLTRNGLDYSFFQILTERIEHASAEEQPRLITLRETLLDFVNQMDKALEEQMKQANAFVEQILNAPDPAQAAAQNAARFNDELIAQALETRMREASQKKDQALLEKIQRVVAVIQQANIPPEMELIQALVDASPTEMEQILNANQEMVTEELSGMFASLMQQVESQAAQNPEAAQLLTRLEQAYGVVLRFQMKKSQAG